MMEWFYNAKYIVDAIPKITYVYNIHNNFPFKFCVNNLSFKYWIQKSFKKVYFLYLAEQRLHNSKFHNSKCVNDMYVEKIIWTRSWTKLTHSKIYIYAYLIAFDK